jgi:molecular chaperone GrpE
MSGEEDKISSGSAEEKNNEPVKNNDDLEKCRRERDEYLDGWRRAKADFLNYKKEEAARMEQFLKFGQENFVRELLPVLDSFYLAIDIGQKHNEDVRGLEMIFSQLEDVMRKFGLQRIEVKPGEKFDASRHEAVAEVESQEAAGAIVNEVGRGYMLYEKVIRPARVRISKGQSIKN